MSEKKPPDHPDYLIPGTCLYSFSRWSRENDPKPPPSFKVGDVVRIVSYERVTKVYEDCDGTALYALDEEPLTRYGVGETHLTLAPEGTDPDDDETWPQECSAASLAARLDAALAVKDEREAVERAWALVRELRGE